MSSRIVSLSEKIKSEGFVRLVTINMGNTKFVDGIEVKTIGECYNCHNNINHSVSKSCNGTCYMCWKCLEIQHIDKINNVVKGHNIICDRYIKPELDDYYNLDKQTYTNTELNKNIEYIYKNPEQITEKYNSYDWNESMYDRVGRVLDYVCKYYNNSRFNDYECYGFIYNNIVVSIENNSEISDSNIRFMYVLSQINIGDLDKLKQVFKFLIKET
jgi:hypothetical protein